MGSVLNSFKIAMSGLFLIVPLIVFGVMLWFGVITVMDALHPKVLYEAVAYKLFLAFGGFGIVFLAGYGLGIYVNKIRR